MLFGIGAVLLWRQRQRDRGGGLPDRGRSRRFLPAPAMAFAVVFAAEFGDLTRSFA